VITPAIFPDNESDVKLLLNGIYSDLRETSIYNQGLFGFGILDGATPNAYNWGNTPIARAGNGSLTPTDGQFLTFAWTRAYSIINKSNYFLNIIEEVQLPEEVRSTYIGEAHFLRGLAYSRLAELYGGVPLITTDITTEEARELSRASGEETWNQAISDYDIAIENLDIDAPEEGRATKGA